MNNTLSQKIAVLFFLFAPISLQAAEGMYTNYIPLYGDFAVAVAPEPGFLVRNDFYYYDAKSTSDRPWGAGLTRQDFDLVIANNLTSGFWISEKKILGAKYGMGATFSFVHSSALAHFNAGGTIITVDDHTNAPSDFTIAPVLLGWNTGNLHILFAEYIVMPSGSYNVDRPVNAGLNYWSFDTNVAVTYLSQKTGSEASFNIGHIYNTENPATRYQTGQEIHFDFMLNQFFSESFALGIHGFIHRQIKRDTGQGANLGAFKAEDDGVGPALLWIPKIGEKKLIIVARWLEEYHAANRLEGRYFMFTLGMEFN